MTDFRAAAAARLTGTTTVLAAAPSVEAIDQIEKQRMGEEMRRREQAIREAERTIGYVSDALKQIERSRQALAADHLGSGEGS